MNLPNGYTPDYLAYPMQIIDFGKFQDWRAANPAALVRNVATSTLNERRNDYVVTEKVSAAYALARYAAERTTVIVGGRYEQTDTTVEGYRVAGSTLTALERSSSYSDFLPSAAVNYDMTEAVKLRLSYAKAIGRPNPSDLGTNETLDQNNLTLSRGNPDLKPREADNFDLSVEYYLPGGQGALTAATFYKDIRNDIFSAAAGTTVIDGATYAVTQPQNLAGSTVFGIELGLVKNRLDFLPGFLGNFGISGNVTWLDAEAEMPSGRTFDRLIQQPNWQYNAAIFYEDGPFKARATYAKVGNQYTAISESDPNASRYDSAYQQLDLQARLTIRGVDLIAEARNITNERRRNFDGYGTRDESVFGRQFWLGAAFRL